jgi:replicative DNA helicase
MIGLQTPLQSWNNKTQGLQAGDLVIAAGPPIWQDHFCDEFSRRVIFNEDLPVVVFNGDAC